VPFPSSWASEGGAGSVDAGSRRLAAIAFVDVVGYSMLMGQDETGTHNRWMKILAEIIRPATHRHRGTVVKLTGDGVLAEFRSAVDAVEWARDVQLMLHKEDAARDPRFPSLMVRIAVHLGDVIEAEGDIYGDGVNMTARLLPYAEAGGISLSEAVHDVVRGSLGVPARDLGLLNLKGYPKPVRAYALSPEGASAPTSLRSRPSALPSIAVAPLINLGSNIEDDYFAEGVVEDIIVSLAGLRELLVISRTSTVPLARRKRDDPGEIGRALGVRYVLVGTIRRSARTVRVSLRLHDVESGATLWTDTTETPPGELFDLQDRIVHNIIAGIAPHVRAAELRSALRRRPDNFTAYDYTLRALAFINSLEKSTFLKARECLNRAMAEDESFAMPVAWAARWHSLSIGQGWSANPVEDARHAATLAAKAIELDRHNALALATYGHARSFLFHDYDSALVYFDRALAAGPNSSLAWILSSGTLSYVGRGEEAVRHAQHAIWLSPFDQSIFYYYMFLGLAYYSSGAYEEAAKWGHLSLQENPRYTANLRILAASLSALGRMDEAREIAAKLTSLQPEFSLAAYERTLQPFRDTETKARYMDHLRITGLAP
jgi:adenylate cyclase